MRASIAALCSRLPKSSRQSDPMHIDKILREMDGTGADVIERKALSFMTRQTPWRPSSPWAEAGNELPRLAFDDIGTCVDNPAFICQCTVWSPLRGLLPSRVCGYVSFCIRHAWSALSTLRASLLLRTSHTFVSLTKIYINCGKRRAHFNISCNDAV